MGSQLFSIKVHPFPGIGPTDTYRKQDDFDECVYLVHILQESKKKFFDTESKIKERQAQIIADLLMNEINEKNVDFNSLEEDERQSMVNKYIFDASIQAHREFQQEYSTAVHMFKYECALNKNQY